jgi:hypothetical protein
MEKLWALGHGRAISIKGKPVWFLFQGCQFSGKSLSSGFFM